MADVATEKQTNGDTRVVPELEAGLFVFILLIAAGLGAVFVYAVPQQQSWSVAAFGTMAAGAALLVGALLGLVFGIPRSLQADHDHAKGSTTDTGRSLYGANTNLEQISDWLTKILVGVGLTQLTQLPALIRSLGAGLSPGLGGGDLSGGFGVVLSIYFAVTGFLGGYLSTRILLPDLFRQADLSSLIKASVRKEVLTQADADAKALTLLDRHLTRGPQDRPAQKELDEAIKAASPLAKVQAFQQARNMLDLARTTNDQDRIARTIPVFKALTATDSADYFHRNHAQLGIALQEQAQPDWAQSEAELTKAIGIRDRRKLRGWRSYEVRRARARIRLEATGGPPRKESIVSDLRAAAADERGRQRIAEDKDIQDWLANAKVDIT
jgi:hypothetical protein